MENGSWKCLLQGYGNLLRKYELQKSEPQICGKCGFWQRSSKRKRILL